MNNQLCSACQRILPVESFYKGNSHLGLSYKCKACTRDYRAANKTRIAAQEAAWRANNPETVRNYKKPHFRSEEAKEKRRIADRARYAADPEKYRAKSRAKYAENPDPHSKRQEKRRANLKAAPGQLPKKIRDQLIEKFGELCMCCGSTEKVSIDHVIPISKGGSKSIENIQLLCIPCNVRKLDTATDYRTPKIKKFCRSFQEKKSIDTSLHL